ncbi:hypothetical protein NKH74_16500 [Mesorhizobium sp. M0933]|uniref:hypothetical protein n=1 Tax=Mesorhizobium sp. M0933 TaxID=2957030 RepID=UPI00333599C9
MTIHFVVPREFADLAEQLPGMELGRNYPYWMGGHFNWVAQSWLVLRQFRPGLTIGTDVRPGVINFGHSLLWRNVGPRIGEFRVGARADFPRLFDVDFEVLQNPAVSVSAKQAYLPYWPVPGQIERDSSRNGLRTIAYAGRIGKVNLAGEILSGDWFGPKLNGLQFKIVPPDKWHDMSEIDLLVAIRSFDRCVYPGKPPSKLFNAWRSSIPLLAGYDNAFSAVGQPNVDYVRIGSQPEFLQSLTQLREDSIFYERIVAAGRARAQEVSHERIAECWLDVIDQRIVPAYKHWYESGGSTKRRILAKIADQARNMASAVKAVLRATAF